MNSEQLTDLVVEALDDIKVMRLRKKLSNVSGYHGSNVINGHQGVKISRDYCLD